MTKSAWLCGIKRDEKNAKIKYNSYAVVSAYTPFSFFRSGQER